MSQNIKTVNGKTFDLDELASRYGSIKGTVQNKAQIVPSVFSEEEYAMLPYCPRSSQASELGSSFPNIGGKKALLSMLTREEKDHYYAYKKQLPSHNKGSSTPNAPKCSNGWIGRAPSPEQEAVINDIRAFLAENNASPELRARFEALVPQKRIGLYERLFGVANPMQLHSKVSLAWVMYTRKDGTRHPNMHVTIAEVALNDEYARRYTMKQVREMLDDLYINEGINAEATIEDLALLNA